MPFVRRAAEAVRDDHDAIAVIDGPEDSRKNTHIRLRSCHHKGIDPTAVQMLREFVAGEG